MTKDLHRFLRLVEISGSCWEWSGYKNQQGYGIFWLGKGPKRAHRVLWQWLYGRIPAGMAICHRCDNPSCVRPRHLFLGTYSDNMRDAVEKGRNKPLYGASHHMTRHTSEEVRYAKHLYFAERRTQVELAAFFGVRQSTISTWIRGVTRGLG